MSEQQATTGKPSISFAAMATIANAPDVQDDMPPVMPPAASASIEDSEDDLEIGGPIDADASPEGETREAGGETSSVPEEDEDDIEVGEQIDIAPGDEGTAENGRMVEASADASEAAASGDATLGEAVLSLDEAASPAGQDGRAERMAQMAARAPGGFGGGGSNPSPAVIGALAGAGLGALAAGPAAAVGGAALGAAGAAGGFRVVSDNIKRASGRKADPNAPTRMSLAERLANRDPETAEKYYARAGREAIRNKVYRDAYHGVDQALDEAVDAGRDFATGVSEYNAAVLKAAAGTELASMAEKDGSQVADYLRKVVDGRVSDAKARSIAKSLGDDAAVSGRREALLAASRKFMDAKERAVRHADSLDANFPGKVDTGHKLERLGKIAEKMAEQDPMAVDDKIKKMMEEIRDFAAKIAEMVRAAIEKVAQAVSRGPSAQ